MTIANCEAGDVVLSTLPTRRLLWIARRRRPSDPMILELVRRVEHDRRVVAELGRELDRLDGAA